MSNLSFSPAGLFYFYFPGTSRSRQFEVKATFPNLPNQGVNPDIYSQWKFEVNLTEDTPWLTINGITGYYTGDLGNLINGVYEKKLNFEFLILDNLKKDRGIYYATCFGRVTAFNSVTGEREIVLERQYNILLKLELNEEEYLHSFVEWEYVDKEPGTVIFNFYKEESTHDLYRYITVFHNIPITAHGSVNSLLETTVLSNTQYSIIEVYLYPEPGWNLGRWFHYVQINSKQKRSTKIPVTINVFQTRPEVIPITVVPDNVVFNITLGAAYVTVYELEVKTNLNWIIVSDLPAWLQVTVSSDNKNKVILRAINFLNMDMGTYSTRVLFSDGVNQYAVTVTLRLSYYVKHPFVSKGLYFTKSLDYVRFNSQEHNTYIRISLYVHVFKLNDAYGSGIIYDRYFDLPLFNGQGKFHIGSVVHTLLEEIERIQQVVPVFQGNYIQDQYCPAEIELFFLEVTNEGDYIAEGHLGRYFMIKGHPKHITAKQMSLLATADQEFSRITVNSVLAINFAHFHDPIIIVRVNNIVLEELKIPRQVKKVLYTYYRFSNPDLKVGDVVEVMVSNDLEMIVQRYLVLPEGVNSTFFFFENNNGMIEAYEFTGRRKISSNYTHITAARFKDLHEYNEKISTKNTQTFFVNTGEILPADHRIIDALIKSENVWCAFDGSENKYIKVDAVSSKMTNADSEQNENSYEIEFNVLENTNATVYPF